MKSAHLAHLSIRVKFLQERKYRTFSHEEIYFILIFKLQNRLDNKEAGDLHLFWSKIGRFSDFFPDFPGQNRM